MIKRVNNIIIHGANAFFEDCKLTVYKVFQKIDEKETLLLNHSHFYYECHLIISGIGTSMVCGRHYSFTKAICSFFRHKSNTVP